MQELDCRNPGPVQILLSSNVNGEFGLDASNISVHSSKSMTGNVADCNLLGMILDNVLDIDPQPDNTAELGGSLKGEGKSIASTYLLNFKGRESLIKAMSFGCTVL